MSSKKNAAQVSRATCDGDKHAWPTTQRNLKLTASDSIIAAAGHVATSQAVPLVVLEPVRGTAPAFCAVLQSSAQERWAGIKRGNGDGMGRALALIVFGGQTRRVSIAVSKYHGWPHAK